MNEKKNAQKQVAKSMKTWLMPPSPRPLHWTQTFGILIRAERNSFTSLPDQSLFTSQSTTDQRLTTQGFSSHPQHQMVKMAGYTTSSPTVTFGGHKSFCIIFLDMYKERERKLFQGRYHKS